VLITFLRPLGHAVYLRTIRCVDLIFEAAGLYFACICVFVTLNGRWAAVFMLACFCLFIIFIGLQGGHVIALKVGVLRSPELRRLAVWLLFRAIQAKTPSTTERYSTAFQKFRDWSSCERRLLICRPMNCQLPSTLNFCYKIIGRTLHLNLLVMAFTGRTICMVFQALAIQN